MQIEQDTFLPDGETETISFNKITFISGNLDAEGDVVITATNGVADETGEELTADVSDVVDKNDLNPDFEFQ